MSLRHLIERLRRALISPAAPMALGLVVLALILDLRPLSDPDFYWHLAAGNWILAHGSIPSSDLFSWWATGHAWIDQEWGSEILTALAYRAGGTTGYALAYLPLIGGILGLMALVIRRSPVRPGAMGTAALLLIGSLVGLGVFAPRAQMWDLLLGLAVLWSLFDWRAGGRRGRMVLPLVALAWANLHGGGLPVFGLICLGFLVGGELDFRLGWSARAPAHYGPLILALIASIVAAALNPSGLAVYGYWAGTVLSAAQRSTISEWASPDFSLLVYWPLLAWITAGLVIGAAARIRNGTVLLLSGGFAVMALLSYRFSGLYGVISAALVGPYLLAAGARLVGRLTERSRGTPPALPLRALVMGLISLLLAVRLVGLAIPGSDTTYLDSHFPVGAADWLSSHPHGRIFNLYQWGGYLAWRLDEPIAVYGAADVLGDAILLEDANLVLMRESPDAFLMTAEVKTVVMDPKLPLSVYLRSRPEWGVVYEDQVAVIFVWQGVSGSSGPRIIPSP